jgi:hypothetical protein
LIHKNYGTRVTNKDEDNKSKQFFVTHGTYHKTKSKEGLDEHNIKIHGDPHNRFKVVNEVFNLESSKTQLMKGMMLAFCGTAG